MTTFATVSDGNVIIDDDVNQYKDFLNAIFEATTTNGEIGRLVAPTAAAHPGTPALGMMYMKTNEGVESSGGRIYMRHAKNGSGAAVWVPYLPLRQRVEGASLIGASLNSTGYTDVTGATLSITTTGGRLHIFVIAGLVGSGQVTIIGGASSSLGGFQCLVGAVTLAPKSVGSAQLTNTTMPGEYGTWEHQPAAGTYTVKLQGTVLHATSSIAFTGRLVVIEYGD